MGDIAPECYMVAADITGDFGDTGFNGGAVPPKILPVFSSRDAARKRIRDSQAGDATAPTEVDRRELKHILNTARDAGYTHVTLDGREMGIDGFCILLDHEQLD